MIQTFALRCSCSGQRHSLSTPPLSLSLSLSLSPFLHPSLFSSLPYSRSVALLVTAILSFFPSLCPSLPLCLPLVHLCPRVALLTAPCISSRGMRVTWGGTCRLTPCGPHHVLHTLMGFSHPVPRICCLMLWFPRHTLGQLTFREKA